MGRRGRNGGHGGFGYTGYGRVFGHVIGHNYSVANSASKKVLCIYLLNSVFNCGHKSAANQMRTSWVKLVHHIGNKYRQDIDNDLNSKIKRNIVTPVRSTQVLVSHTTQEALVRTDQSNIQAARRAQAIILR